MFDDLRDLYQDTVIDRSRHPRHGVRLAAFDAMAEGDNPMCGDRCRVFVRNAPSGHVAEIGFEAGLSSSEIRSLATGFEALARTGETDDAALEPLRPLSGVHEYPSRVKCATLPWRALIAALDGATEATSE
jgi:nitrogen fixation NifU-like protein